MSRILKSAVVFFVLGVLILPFTVFARTCEVTDIKKSGEPDIKLQVAIGEATCVSGISEYISTFYKFFVGAVATLAIFMIVIGGVKWLFARGNPGKITAAKNTIGSALMGMLLVFVSVALLRIINPDLISLKLPKLKSIQQVLFYDTIKCNDPLLKGKEINVGGQKVPGGIDNDSFKCGSSYNIEGTRQDCAGTSCVNEKGEKGTCTPRDCLYGGGIWGTIGWDGSFYTDNVTVVAVCSDNDPRLVWNGYTQTTGNRIEDYAIQFPIDQFVKKGNDVCGSEPRGYLVAAQVNDASSKLPTWDDDVVFDKTCKNPVRDSENPDKFVSYNGLHYISPSTPLFSSEEIGKIQVCNIEIRPSGSYAAHPPLSERVQYKEEQWKAATNDLKRFLIDMNTKQSLIITSISDDNIYNDTCKPWANPPQSGDCQHTLKMDAGGLVISAHYGGPNQRVKSKNSEGYSCAADVKPVNATSQTAWDALSAAATGAPFQQCEKAGSTNPAACDPNATHLHVSVAGCGSQ